MGFEVLNTKLYITIGIIYLLAMLLLWMQVKKRNRKRAIKRAEFISKIGYSIENGACITLKDAITIYLSHFELNQLSIINYEDLVLSIRKAIDSYSTRSSLLSNNAKQTISSAKALLSEAELELEKISKEAPFMETPSPERQMLEDIRSMTKDPSGLVMLKLYDLARSIRDRERLTNVASEQAATSLLYAKRGIWLTIVFGVVSVALTIWLS